MPGIFNPDVEAEFTSGTKVWFYQNIAPAGWTIVTGCTDSLLAVKGGSNAYNVTGGNQAGTWTQPNHHHSGPNHRHSGPSHTHTVNPPQTESGNVVNLISPRSDVETVATGTNLLHTHTVDIASFSSGAGGTGNTGYAGGGWTGNSATANTYRPLANVGIICTKD